MASPATATTPIGLVDLQAQRARLGDRIDLAIQRVLDHGRFIMGPEVDELEARLAEYCGVHHAVSCSSGTDALLMAMLALRIGHGDAVILPTFTFAATAEVVALVGATPVFVDVLPDTFTLDPAGLEPAVDTATRRGLRPRVVMPVDLFGQPADYDAIEPFCTDHDLVLLPDAAQSFGATWHDRRAGSIGALSCTSFFPSKPLGCYGDGGALFTDDDEHAEVLRSLRVHGQGADKYDNVRIGLNGRLDTIQAAVLLEKLAIFDKELGARRRIAARYTAELASSMVTPAVRPEAESAWAQYTVVIDRRDDVAKALRARGVATAVYYPRPLHRQLAYRAYPTAGDTLPVSDELATRVLSLPMHPYLDEDAQTRVIAAVLEAVADA